MSLKDLYALPPSVPIPQLYCHVIAGCQDEWLYGVDSYGSDVVRMRLEGGDFLGGVVVVYSELEVIATAYYPVLSGDEAAGSYRDVGEFEGLDDGLAFVGPYVYMAAV